MQNKLHHLRLVRTSIGVDIDEVVQVICDTHGTLKECCGSKIAACPYGRGAFAGILDVILRDADRGNHRLRRVLGMSKECRDRGTRYTRLLVKLLQECGIYVPYHLLVYGQDIIEIAGKRRGRIHATQLQLIDRASHWR